MGPQSRRSAVVSVQRRSVSRSGRVGKALAPIVSTHHLESAVRACTAALWLLLDDAAPPRGDATSSGFVRSRRDVSSKGAAWRASGRERCVPLEVKRQYRARRSCGLLRRGGGLAGASYGATWHGNVLGRYPNQSVEQMRSKVTNRAPALHASPNIMGESHWRGDFYRLKQEGEILSDQVFQRVFGAIS